MFRVVVVPCTVGVTGATPLSVANGAPRCRGR